MNVLLLRKTGICMYKLVRRQANNILIRAIHIAVMHETDYLLRASLRTLFLSPHPFPSPKERRIS